MALDQGQLSLFCNCATVRDSSYPTCLLSIPKCQTCINTSLKMLSLFCSLSEISYLSHPVSTSISQWTTLTVFNYKAVESMLLIASDNSNS